ncbi:hypothetical protein AURDEDRAFT_131540 [Auricularia subglabra TFB-10046 SS5]|uniref:SET domain-containing protein n=1 Tax=Auricularia subglabra (strain TFB-10046 / SS5) TaxID=717982 RepID=J0CTP8_AURST|nr:hypothetical protein AURDEDRAFT_131540 [Auricularia subglabra TFB-10046 SS5]
MSMSTSALALGALLASIQNWHSPGAPKPGQAGVLENAIVGHLYGVLGFGIAEPCMPQSFPEERSDPPVAVHLDINTSAHPPLSISDLRSLLHQALNSIDTRHFHLRLLLEVHLWIHLEHHPVELFTPVINGTRQVGVRTKQALPKGVALYCLAGFFSEVFESPGVVDHPSTLWLDDENSHAVVLCGPARFLNSVCSSKGCSACRGARNCEFLGQGQKKGVFVRLTRDVQGGEELLMEYGAGYFNGQPCGRVVSS